MMLDDWGLHSFMTVAVQDVSHYTMETILHLHLIDFKHVNLSKVFFFYVYKLGNHIHCMCIFTFFVLKSFLL